MTERDRFHPDEPSMPERTARVQIRFGEEIRTFTPEDTIIRRFTQGDGAFDHCVYRSPDGHLIAFTPHERAMEELVRLGFPIRNDDTIDEATITHYSKVQAGQIDTEREYLD